MFIVKLSLTLQSGRVLVGWIRQNNIMKEQIELTDLQRDATRFTNRSRAEDAAFLVISEIGNEAPSNIRLDFHIYAVKSL